MFDFSFIGLRVLCWLLGLVAYRFGWVVYCLFAYCVLVVDFDC